MSSKDYSTGSLILRLNALRSPIITAGMMTWRDISWNNIHYTAGRWFMGDLEVKPRAVDDLLTRIEAMCE